jgi:hypothetical protein
MRTSGRWTAAVSCHACCDARPGVSVGDGEAAAANEGCRLGCARDGSDARTATQAAAAGFLFSMQRWVRIIASFNLGAVFFLISFQIQIVFFFKKKSQVQ